MFENPPRQNGALRNNNVFIYVQCESRKIYGARVAGLAIGIKSTQPRYLRITNKRLSNSCSSNQQIGCRQCLL